MPLVVKDRVQETSTTTGTGTYTLAGAVTGYQSFSVIGNGNTTYYAVSDGTSWEVGIGTYTLSGTTLSRDTILESSNSGNAVNWGAGTKNIFVTYPAERSVATDAANTFTANQVINVADNTNAALRITQTGTGNALVVEDAANPDSTPLAVTSDGLVINGHTSSINVLTIDAGVQNYKGSGYYTAGNFSADAFGSFFTFIKSRNATVGSHTVVQSGDGLGTVAFAGSDGTAYVRGAQIRAEVDGTPGTGDMPGRLVFSTTADGASSPTERMRIDSAGNVAFASGGTVAGQRIRLAGNFTGAASAFGFIQAGTVQSDVTNTFVTYRSEARTAATAFTLPNYWHFHAAQLSIGAGSSITTQIGYLADSTMIGATANNFGFYSDIASGTGRWNFYANGTAANVFAGQTSIGGAVGSESMRVTPTASAVNYWLVEGGPTGVGPALRVEGSDTNIGLTLGSKGSGSLFFATNRSAGFTPQLAVTHTASAVNYVQVTGAATGSAPVISAQGSDTNIQLQLAAKGTGLIRFVTGGGLQAYVRDTASVVNQLVFTGGATGTGPTLSAAGSDTNIDLTLTPKGTGKVVITNGIAGGTF